MCVEMFGHGWGCDLWDGYDSVVGHVTNRTEDMISVYSQFFKEKGELEKEYAKGLRKLVARFEPAKRKKKEEGSESTETSSFRWNQDFIDSLSIT